MGVPVVTFDPNVNLGQIISFMGFMFGGLAVLVTMRSDVKSLKGRLDQVDNELRKQTEILVTLGRQDERLKVYAEDLNDLKLTVKAMMAEQAINRQH